MDTSTAVIVVIFLSIIAFVIYWLPTINAFTRHHRQRAAIAGLNFFGGWTVIGWIVAMVWSMTAQDTPGTSPTL
ncbi:superinfection immunity protein [Phenylobacterium sp.]|uniref:superinfection immunity protein n=1 Tax=Phenylobacterium sp. TaxID=1871053 RepID=UPI00374D2DD7